MVLFLSIHEPEFFQELYRRSLSNKLWQVCN